MLINLNEQNKLKEIIEQHDKILIFSGAGVSQNSGITDYKHADDYFSKKRKDYFTHTELMDKRLYNLDKALFYEYFFDLQKLMLNKQSNIAHKFPEQLGDKLLGVITQNIDGLYCVNQEKLCEIHGNINEFICLKCKKICDYSLSKKGIPHSQCCGFEAKPNVVLYGEQFSDENVLVLEQWFEQADCIIVMGTELKIYPHHQKIACSNACKVLLNRNDVTLTKEVQTAYGASYEQIEWNLKIIGDISETLKGIA